MVIRFGTLLSSSQYGGYDPRLVTEWVRIPSNTGLYLLRERTTRGLLATDHVILNHGQVTWTTPELAPPLLNTTPHQREDVSALDRFNVHRCPTRRVFSGTGLEPVTKQATVRYLYHSATAAATGLELMPQLPRVRDHYYSVTAATSSSEHS
ncbi:uncharacterized protein TNCV_1847661 [Trichonephila clavipes]|nr:uncharacterized protein TNCV_1847661 [Trichonephila clavipes]